jgi:hypothetical protein
MRIPGVLLVSAALLFAGLRAAGQVAVGECQPMSKALSKILNTPTHVYTTETAAFRGGKPTITETIYDRGAIYVKLKGRWIRSTVTAQQMLEQPKEDPGNVHSSCHYVRDEMLNGEIAAVYSSHSETEDYKSDTQTWISKSKGLPLRAELDIDVGGKLGKSHRSMRYEYNNIQPPTL